MKTKVFTLRAGLMRPFGVLSEDRSMLIRLHLGCLPNERIRPVRNSGYALIPTNSTNPILLGPLNPMCAGKLRML